ncbi:5-formyltetrahydrofolate cyclo-ligase [Neomicrococcus lactis]|uniref:5-formyltetrahydrofolate cyclo-ligase n=1 Tax=Neomicrococcus lactis TaxID=732241 RepID=UPI0023000422|nr:5-formyltetrahydrofolate cyclo-ligase [Neomicrococcus lactis]
MDTPAGASLDDQKQALRKHYRAARKNLPVAEREAQMALTTGHVRSWLDQNAEHRAFTAVLPYGAEPPLMPFLMQMHDRRYRILVPITEPERQLSFVEWTPGVAMERSSVAPIDEPVGPRVDFRAMAEVDLMLVPAQVVDDQGGRMGQGGGYYDRFLEKVRTLADPPKLYALVFDHELVPAGTFPVEDFDQRVDGVFTSAGLTLFNQ